MGVVMTEHRRNDKKLEPWRDPRAEPYIRFENVTKRFGDFTAVNNVSLKIYRGEIFCLLGGSGCGKSTLLRMMAGFESISSGKIFLDGQDMEEFPPYDRQVNMMFQSYALFPHMTVAENVAFGLRQDGLKGEQRGLTGVTMIEDVRAAVAASVSRTGDRNVAVIPEGPYVVPQYRPPLA